MCKYCSNPKQVGKCFFYPNIVDYDKNINQNPQFVSCIRKLNKNYTFHIEEVYLESDESFSSGSSINVPIYHCPECGKELNDGERNN